MIDKDIVLNKADKVTHHIRRIKKKRDVTLEEFLSDLDLQEIIMFNIQMAVQNCIDLAAHIISDEELGIAGSTNEMFYILQENGYLSTELADKMVAAVGFRNLIVHEYGKIDLKQVYEIVQSDIDELEMFLKTILQKLKL